jgi:hypothetical protein
MLTNMKRTLAVATAAAIALTAVSVTPASAGRRGNNAAAAIAMFAIVAGTIATIAAADQRRSDWDARQRAYNYGYPPPPHYRHYYRPY